MAKKTKYQFTRTVNPIDPDGTINLNCSALNDDWIRSARLVAAARNGDEEARKKVEELDNEPMYYVDTIEEDEV